MPYTMPNNSIEAVNRPMIVRTFRIVAVALVVATAACNNEPNKESPEGVATQRADSIHQVDSVKKANALPDTTFPEIHYRKVAITSRAMFDSIRKAFPRGKEESQADGFRVLTTMNRKEFGYFHVGDTVSLPDTIINDLRAYSIFPMRYPAADTLKKIILISNKYQSYACYEHGRLIRFAACNTGTERKPTFPGRYALNWKERLRISSLNDNWKLPFTWNFHFHAGNAFHQFTMPGRPVSHSCVRQFMTDAKWLFDWGEGGSRDSSGVFREFTGTPVIIVDIFDFTRPRGGPWLELASNRDATLKLPDNPMGVEEALIPMSQVPTGARGGVPNRQRYLTAEDTLRARGIIRPGVSLSASINYNAIRKAKEKRAGAAVKPRQKSSGSTTPPAGASDSPE